MKKIIVCLIFVGLFIGKIRAQQYFDFNLNKNYLYEDKELNVQFLYEFEGYSEENFIVRPKIKRGNIEIYDNAKNVWIGHSDLWTNMPVLEKNMKVRVNLTGESELFFEIQNTINSEIYETHRKSIWGGNMFGNYIEKINDNVFSYGQLEKKTSPITNEAAQLKPIQPEKPPSLLAKVIKYIGDII